MTEAQPTASVARPTALVFASLALGQLLTLAAMSLLSACLGLGAFGRYGILLLDFAVFSNLANFALPAVAVPYAVRAGLSDASFAAVMGTRLWTSLPASAGFLAFELLFRRGDGLSGAAAALALAILFNPMQLEWWLQARGDWRGLFGQRVLAGAVNLALVWLVARASPGLPAAAAAYAGGAAAAFLFMLFRSGPLRLPWPSPRSAAVRGLWIASLPIALTGVFDFLFAPLGYYVFRFLGGEGPLLGAYGIAHRLALAASLFASSLFTVLLPRFSRAPSGTGTGDALARLLDRAAVVVLVLLFAAPFCTRTALRLLFPSAGWTEASLAFGGWALSCFALSTGLHLLRMAPLTLALARGGNWLYCRLFFLAGAVNLAAAALGAATMGPKALPAFALAADLVFTGAWWIHLHGAGRRGWLRAALLAAGAALYLAWCSRWF